MIELLKKNERLLHYHTARIPGPGMPTCASYEEPLREDDPLWAKSRGRWGGGGGYRDQNKAYSEEWLTASTRDHLALRPASQSIEFGTQRIQNALGKRVRLSQSIWPPLCQRRQAQCLVSQSDRINWRP